MDVVFLTVLNMSITGAFVIGKTTKNQQGTDWVNSPFLVGFVGV